MTFRETISGALVLGPMTKGSNLPYRRLCVELGARVLVSEMVVARRLKQKRRSEFALIRRAPAEPCFGVQLAGNKPEEVAWAAALVEARGADFVDLNLGCPIDHFTRMGLGAALGRQPARVRRIVEAMRQAVAVPVTVKIRLGWDADHLNYLDLAQAIVDGGASAITVHGRTREARYRSPADWSAIAAVAAAVAVPVIGNGDVLFAHEAHEHLTASGCAAVMTARGCLIKPWLFREMTEGYWDITADERVAIYRRYVALATEHWGFKARDESGAPEGGPAVLDDHARERVREFLRWHVGFWVRYAPQRPDGSWPSMQQRESSFVPRSPLEALLARHDDAAVDYITEELLDGGDLSHPPAVGDVETEPGTDGCGMTAVLLVLSIAASTPQAPAPTGGQVVGIVTAAATGNALADVQVVIAQPAGTRTARTGADGRFLVDGLRPGAATVTVSTIGYIFVRRRVSVPADGVLELTIPLAEGTGTYEESVTVTPATEVAPAGAKRELSSGALQDLRGVAADDPVRAVQALPGVATGDDFQAEFSVRGSAYRHLGLVIDSVATPLLFHSVRGAEDTGSIAMINTDIVSRAALRTGAHPAPHGDWLGATLDFDIREGSRDRVALRTAVSGTNTSAVLEGPLTRGKRGSWLVSIRKSYVDWLIRKIDPEVESTFGFLDTQGKVVFDLTPRQQVQLLVLGGHAVYRKPSANSANEIARAGSTSALASAHWRLATDRVLASQRLTVVSNKFKNRGLFFQEHARGNMDEIVWRGDVTMPVRGWTVDAGASSAHQEYSSVLRNFQTANATTTRIRAERTTANTRTMTGGWFNVGGRIASVGLTGGVRVSHDSLVEASHVSPWLLAERALGTGKLIVSASRVVQYSSLEHVGAAVAPLRAERAWLVDAGIRQPLSASLGVSVTAFRRDESDILRRTEENRLVNGARVAESIFPSVISTLSGTAKGAELVIERRSERGPSGWVAYAWAHTQHHDRLTGETFDGDFDQRHTLNAVVQQRLSYRLRVMAKFRYGSNFPILGYYAGTHEALVLGPGRNLVRLPAYVRLDLSGSRTFTFSRSRLTLFVEVMNVTNRDNYGPADGSIRTNLSAANFTEKLIPLVPSAGLLIEF